jgi:hypothetical protein
VSAVPIRIGIAESIKVSPKYDKGDVVWLVVAGLPGSFKMTIISDPKYEAGSWQYQLQDSSGQEYENGKWIPEKQLNSKS